MVEFGNGDIEGGLLVVFWGERLLVKERESSSCLENQVSDLKYPCYQNLLSSVFLFIVYACEFVVMLLQYGVLCKGEGLCFSFGV